MLVPQLPEGAGREVAAFRLAAGPSHSLPSVPPY